MHKTLPDRVLAVLKAHPGRPFTSAQLAEFLIQKNESGWVTRKGQSSHPPKEGQTLFSQIRAEISGKNQWKRRASNPEMSDLIIDDSGSCMTFMWNSQDGNDKAINECKKEIKSLETTRTKAEEAMYEPFVRWLECEKKIKASRLDEKSGRNKGEVKNIWLYPDIVGYKKFKAVNVNHEINWLMSKMGSSKGMLYSFELKLTLEPKTVRENYFQAVSNSTWANYGYLVAEYIDDGVKAELEMLADMFGIGVIKFDKNDLLTEDDEFKQSRILIPAKTKTHISWDMVGRICEQTDQMTTFLETVRRDID